MFLDRTRERSVLDDLLNGALEGRSGALVIYGDAGMGKTAMLEYAARTSDLSVARISGVETESSFGFAALHRLAVPFLHEIDRLPSPQRTALESAFGLVDAPTPDRFMVALAALNLLSSESGRSGLLCIVDDGQWIDVESLQTLAFVGRRLRAEGIVLLFGLRTYLDVPSDLAGLPSLEVSGLPDDAVSEILNIAADRPVPAQLAKDIAAETNGCPLALWEMGSTLTESRSAFAGLLDKPVAVTRQLENHFNQEVASLSYDGQLFLLAAAADTSGDRALVRAVANRLGCTREAEAETERRQFILPGPVVRFRHPLIRSASYVSADPDIRVTVHRTYASLISKATYPDRWARHVVLGTTGPDSVLASELEETSQIAKARGGYTAECALLVQASELTDSLELRAKRLVRAAEAAMNAGDHNQANALLDQAQSHISEPLTVAEAEQLRGQLSIRNSQPAEAARQLLAAARLFKDSRNLGRARETLLEAFAGYGISLHLTQGLQAHEIAETVQMTRRENAFPASLEDHLLDGTALLFTDGPQAAFEDYRQAALAFTQGEVSHDQIARWFVFCLITANERLDDRAYKAWAERTDKSARENGALLVLLFNLVGMAELDLRAGDLQSATARFDETLDVAAAIGLPAVHFGPTSAEISAWAGDEESTKQSASILIDFMSAVGSGVAVMLGYRALAVLHLGAGRYREALEATACVHTSSPLGWTSQTLPLAVEAAIRSGEPELAESLLERLAVRAEASRTPWALGLLAQSRALVSSGSEAEAFFESALGYLAETLVPRDLAYANLLYGEWLRRENRRLDARKHLRHAHEFFVAMGAKDFAKRAQAELLATGERARSRTVERRADLTPQERRVAQLASERLTNPEIAAQLFISSATVDYHLRKVFRKLDVTSRRQLGEVLRSQAPA